MIPTTLLISTLSVWFQQFKATSLYSTIVLKTKSPFSPLIVSCRSGLPTKQRHLVQTLKYSQRLKMIKAALIMEIVWDINLVCSCQIFCAKQLFWPRIWSITLPIFSWGVDQGVKSTIISCLLSHRLAVRSYMCLHLLGGNRVPSAVSSLCWAAVTHGRVQWGSEVGTHSGISR